MQKESFAVIEKEIHLVEVAMGKLETKKRGLMLKLQKVCRHPQKVHYRTPGGKKCGRCSKTLESWTPHVGNPI